jgi:muconate cycloisomerase
VGDLLGPLLRTELPCDGAVVGFVPMSVLMLLLGQIRRLGKRRIKVKVGRPEDAERLAAVRRVLGGEIEILLDANGAWSADEAVEKISALERFGITAVEQPVPGRDLEGLARVARAVKVPIMADESICNLADALRLLELGGCGLWNLRVGKCGGLLGTLELARLAISQGIAVYLGCLVGESGLLERAGRLVAAHLETVHHLELDSSGNRLDDLLRESLAPVVDNRVVLPPASPGLGVEVDPEKLRVRSAAAGPAGILRLCAA